MTSYFMTSYFMMSCFMTSCMMHDAWYMMHESHRGYAPTVYPNKCRHKGVCTHSVFNWMDTKQNKTTKCPCTLAAYHLCHTMQPIGVSYHIIKYIFAVWVRGFWLQVLQTLLLIFSWVGAGGWSMQRYFSVQCNLGYVMLSSWWWGVVGWGVVWWLRPILVFSLSLGQAKQKWW